ncbi:MAG: diguanylate cyclase [Armatimonadota bacterium]|nr:diguanylate cyclase [Armatimonadota bacterium]
MLLCGDRFWAESLREALQGFASETVITQDLTDALEADADVAVVRQETIDAATEKLRGALQRRWASDLRPLWVVQGAARRRRLQHLETGADLVVGPDIDNEELVAELAALMRRAELERDRNPLTGLPGNRGLCRHLQRRLRDGETLGLVLVDIDDFKGYNDRYGHVHGDAAIAALADAVREAAAEHDGTFVAHIGGDDFSVVARPEVTEAIAEACTTEFAGRLEGLEGGHELAVTAVFTKARPDDAGRLEGVFLHLAKLKRRARTPPMR